MDDSDKRKAAGPTWTARFQKLPIVQSTRAQVDRVRISFHRNPKLAGDVKNGGVCLLIGLILGGLLAGTGDSVLAAASFHPAPSSSVAWSSLKGPGWNPIHVFYGKLHHLHDEIPEKWYVQSSDKNRKEGVSREWFGQHGQDVAVAQFFGLKRDGFFVDLASNDAVWASNTFALETNLGWKGICIEANPVYWYRLSFRTNCHVVGTIVGGKDLEEVKVSLPTDPKAAGPYGGIVGGDFDNKDKKGNVPQARYTASLVGILNKFEAPKVIDYLSLDVEGAEEFIMKDFPFHEPYTFRLISIERPKRLLKKRLHQAGYKQLLDFKMGDTLWAHHTVFDEGKQQLDELGDALNTHVLKDWPKKASGKR